MEKMKWDIEGTQVLYDDGLRFDMWGAGTIQNITTNASGTQTEIVFPDTYSIQRERLPLDELFARIDREEIKITTPANAFLHQWRIREREVVRTPLSEALKEISALPKEELSTLIGLLMNRVEGDNRLDRKEAAELLGAITALSDEQEARQVFNFLLEQTGEKSMKEKWVKYPQTPYMLSQRGHLQQEQYKVAAKCLLVAAEIAKKTENEEMIAAVRSRSNTLRTHRSQIIKRTAKAVLKRSG